VEEKLGTETTGAWFDVKKTVDDFYMEVTRCFRPKASEAFVMRTGRTTCSANCCMKVSGELKIYAMGFMSISRG
jgi:hypothetical protein